MSEIEKIRQKKLAELMARSTKTQPEDGHPDSPVELTDSHFEEFIRRYDNVVVDCWAPWCGPCRMLSPTIEAMAMSFKGRVVFGKLNTDENYETTGRFGISSIPTLLYFKKGELAGRTVGALPRSEIEKQLEYLESL
ncbi:MAG: thioredoxin [Methanobacteriota archaeon]|nr:MAG: thioredoxin [Euryarchaeota archaeon]